MVGKFRFGNFNADHLDDFVRHLLANIFRHHLAFLNLNRGRNLTGNLLTDLTGDNAAGFFLDFFEGVGADLPGNWGALGHVDDLGNLLGNLDALRDVDEAAPGAGAATRLAHLFLDLSTLILIGSDERGR